MNDIEKTRRDLEARLHQLTERLGRIQSDLRAPAERDSEERALEEENDEVLERLDETERREIEKIRAALARIETGTYGACARCGEPIGAKRLAAMPTAVHCIACAA